MEELAGEGSSRLLYAFLLGLCAVLLNAPALLASRLRGTEKLAAWHQQQQGATPLAFLEFQRKIIAVFFLYALAEGLQSVYGGALHENYFGYGRGEIRYMLLAATAASLLAGTILGVLADFTSRRRICIICGVLQFCASSLTRLSGNVFIACLANACRGIEVSVFLIVFEAWLVGEHDRLGFKQDLLNRIFWVMVFATGVAGIASGTAASLLLSKWGLGLLAPSSLAAVISILWVALVYTGSFDSVTSSARPFLDLNIFSAYRAVTDKRVLLLGWTQACLELSFILFWFLWTPTLVADGRDIHSGVMYAYFMASLMVGSVASSLALSGPVTFRPEEYLPWVFGAASLSLFIPAYDHQEVDVLVGAFCIYHICLGIAWPSLARLRSVYFPSDRRAGFLSLFRVPVSAGMLLIFTNDGPMKVLHNSTLFYISAFGLLSASLALRLLNKWRRPISTAEESVSELHRLH